MTQRMRQMRDRLRREYLGQDEADVAPRPAQARAHGAKRGAFTLRGHRLSSLFRDTIHCTLRLMPGY